MSLDPRRRIDNMGFSGQRNRSLNGSDLLCDFIRRDNGNWTIGKDPVQKLCEQREPVPEILVIFLPEVADLINLKTHDEISARFKIPAVFWTHIAQEASGFFGCHDARDVNGELKNFSSQFRFLIKEPLKPVSNFSNANDTSFSYLWHKLGFFTAWTPFKNVTVLCFGGPPALQHSMSNLAQLQLNDPFSFHIILIEKVLALYNTALWSWRDRVREIEQNRTLATNPQPDYVKMHEIARHTIHSSETLVMAIETMTSLIQEHEMFFADNPSFPTESITQSKRTRRALRSQVTLFKCLHLRSQALEERLRNEINLAFNTVAQHDSRIAVQIGEAARVDSAAMKTISLLGLVFLPGTFICALFSTSFFDFSPGSSTEPQQWTVSEKFWIYWAVAIPVTVVTVACWVSWQRVYRKLL